MTDEQTKQAILGFTEFFKGITGNQDLEIPNDIAEKLGIEKQKPSGDNVSRQAVIDAIDNWVKKYRILAIIPTDEVTPLFEAIHELPSAESKWIPMTTRPMDEEEREYYREWSDVDGAMIFDCELPEDGQEVLVSYGGYVCVDTFCKDDGCYFEGVDIDDVDAWQPLPKPYDPQGNGVCGMISDKLTTDDGEPDGTGGQIFCP